MNRYIVGAIMAGLALLAMSGIGGVNGLFADNTRLRDNLSADDSSLGTLPIEQAGRIVQRQGPATTGVTPATGTTIGDTMAPNGGVPNDISPEASYTTPTGVGNNIPNATIRPAQTNVIPRVPEAGQLSTTGDIAPIQPGLIRPETSLPTSDPELDSIPALW
jgi:hypothetical protein